MSVKKNGKKKKENEEPKATLKEKVAEIFELPKEIVLNMPKLVMLGNNSLIIENYKGIIEYGDCRIRVNTCTGMIRITGDKLVIKEITSEDILVSGKISSLEFLE